MPHDTSLDAVLSHNRTVLLDALRAAGAASAVISYSGSGDEGNVNDISVLDASGQPLDATQPVTVMEEDSQYVDGQWQTSRTMVERSLHDALDAFADLAISVYHCGYENGDGGAGEITFDCAAGTVQMAHNAHYTESFLTETDL